ncbi:MAG: TetR/AcrR family transcriptional regulator [Anaerolineales bacterium]
MGAKAEYRSSIRSKRLIRQTFMELLKEKDLEKITVTDIIKRADINRGTFYAHYQDVRAVIEQIENEIIAKMLEFLGEFRHKNFFQNPLPLLLKMSRYLEEDQDFYRILINSKGAIQFLEKLKSIFIEHMKTDSDIPETVKNSPDFIISMNFFAGGVINLYQVWFRGETNYSLNETALVVSKIIKNTSGSLFGFE